RYWQITEESLITCSPSRSAGMRPSGETSRQPSGGANGLTGSCAASCPFSSRNERTLRTNGEAPTPSTTSDMRILRARRARPSSPASGIGRRGEDGARWGAGARPRRAGSVGGALDEGAADAEALAQPLEVALVAARLRQPG